MAWPLRMFDSKGIYFVTVRCFQGRLLLRPSRQTNDVLAGVLARAARLSSVELFAFVFASNHVHLIVRAPNGNLPRFMQFLLTNVSKKVGWLVRWRGSFWEHRYSAEPILDDEAFVGRVRYVLAHGVKERLVRRCGDWPGLSSLPMMLERPPEQRGGSTGRGVGAIAGRSRPLQPRMGRGRDVDADSVPDVGAPGSRGPASNHQAGRRGDRRGRRRSIRLPSWA